MSNLKLQLRRRLVRLRKQHGLSQRQLGQLVWPNAANIQARISHYECGRAEPSYTDLERLANVLGVGIVEILTGAQPIADTHLIKTLSWNRRVLMKEKLSTYDLPILDDAFAPGFMKGDILRIDSRAKLTSGKVKMVVLSNGNLQPIVCLYARVKGKRFFETLGEK